MPAANAALAALGRSAKVLKVLVVTALAIAAGGVLALFLLPAPGFAILAALVLPLLGGREAARLAGVNQPAWGWAYAIGLTMLAALILWRAPEPAWLLAAAAALWLLNLAWLARPGLGRSHRPLAVLVKLLVLGAVLLAAWLGLSLLQALSPWLVVLLAIIIAAADTGAYFSGRHFGGARLAPTISPGKTRAGAAGGLISAAVFAPLAGWLIPVHAFSPAVLSVLAIALALISIGGDLFISLLKRQRNLKDCSTLLPGHGGILDRFDSLSAAVPFYALAVLYLAGPAPH